MTKEIIAAVGIFSLALLVFVIDVLPALSCYLFSCEQFEFSGWSVLCVIGFILIALVLLKIQPLSRILINSNSFVVVLSILLFGFVLNFILYSTIETRYMYCGTEKFTGRSLAEHTFIIRDRECKIMENSLKNSKFYISL